MTWVNQTDSLQHPQRALLHVLETLKSLTRLPIKNKQTNTTILVGSHFCPWQSEIYDTACAMKFASTHGVLERLGNQWRKGTQGTECQGPDNTAACTKVHLVNANMFETIAVNPWRWFNPLRWVLDIAVLCIFTVLWYRKFISNCNTFSSLQICINWIARDLKYLCSVPNCLFSNYTHDSTILIGKLSIIITRGVRSHWQKMRKTT